MTFQEVFGMEIQTLVELYDERPLENVLGVEVFHPNSVVYVCAEKLRGSDKIGDPEKALARKLCDETGAEIRDMNRDDFYKLPEILKRTEGELNVGIRSGNRFKW